MRVTPCLQEKTIVLFLKRRLTAKFTRDLFDVVGFISFAPGNGFSEEEIEGEKKICIVCIICRLITSKQLATKKFVIINASSTVRCVSIWRINRKDVFLQYPSSSSSSLFNLIPNAISCNTYQKVFFLCTTVFTVKYELRAEMHGCMVICREEIRQVYLWRKLCSILPAVVNYKSIQDLELE